MKMNQLKNVAAVLLLSLSCAAACTAAGASAESDPYLGDWEGQWEAKSKVVKQNPAMVAQVVPRGGGAYQINLLSEFDRRIWPYAKLSAQVRGKKLVFDQEGWSGTVSGNTLTGKSTNADTAGTFTLKKVTRLSKRLGAKAPKGAIVLFDGSNFDAWRDFNKADATIPWVIQADGSMRVVTSDDKSKRVNLATKQTFGDCRLHLEFRTPLEPENIDQFRANSGVFLQDVYEVQILDSYGVDATYSDCGALYHVAAPKLNACSPPGQWQSYDITYKAPRFNDAGELTQPATVTVNHNGHLVQRNEPLPHLTSHTQRGRSAAHPTEPGRIWLQDHGHEMEFRNIWLVELD